MNETEHDRMKQLLQQALPPVGEASGPLHDMWPAMLRKLDQRPAPVPWFDWALMGGLVCVVVAFPAAIPVLLYYL